MTGTLQPLNGKFAIVDANGNPTEYFTRWAQQKQIDIGKSIQLSDVQAYLTAHKLIAGTGIQLTPDGNINDGVTIHADAQAILDEITATRGAIIYRGLLGWAALLPDTTGKVLQTNGAGADPSWVTPSGGGGGKPWFWKPPTAANFSTMYASLRAGTIGNALSLTDDTDVGMSYSDPSTESGYMKAVGRPIPLANRGPGTTFTITARLQANSFTANDQIGIWVRASATQYLFFDLFNRGGTINIQRCYYNGAWNDGTFTLFWEDMIGWLRIAVSNQTTTYYISMDGKHWTQVYTSENLFAASFTDYGFCYGRFSTTARWYVTCDSFTSDEFP